jgi:hypothetical protein
VKTKRLACGVLLGDNIVLKTIFLLIYNEKTNLFLMAGINFANIVGKSVMKQFIF